MNYKAIRNHIVLWLKTYAEASNSKGFVIGVSGGIDSAVTSVLCADTGLPLLALNLPIRQNKPELSRSQEHIGWLQERYKNIETETVDLTKIFDDFEHTLPEKARTFLSMANTRARLRMTTLYAFAGAGNLLVTGTGNKVEDFGIGFFTKYGDGGVDISPIADLLKTEIFGLAKQMQIPESIQKASPTDGLFADARTDEEQIGASYPELEWAMQYLQNPSSREAGKEEALSDRQKMVIDIYLQRNRANRHKMVPIPVCVIPKELKESTN